MKIECTKEEKRMLIRSVVKSSICPFPASIDCPVELCQQPSCVRCMNENIEWVIKDGEQE